MSGVRVLRKLLGLTGEGTSSLDCYNSAVAMAIADSGERPAGLLDRALEEEDIFHKHADRSVIKPKDGALLP